MRESCLCGAHLELGLLRGRTQYPDARLCARRYKNLGLQRRSACRAWHVSRLDWRGFSASLQVQCKMCVGQLMRMAGSRSKQSFTAIAFSRDADPPIEEVTGSCSSIWTCELPERRINRFCEAKTRFKTTGKGKKSSTQ